MLYYTWECQKLYIQRQRLRFEHLFASGELERGVWNSLSSITNRLDKTWSNMDEQDLLSGNSAYSNVTGEIAELEHSRDSMDKDLLDRPLQALQQQSVYRTARQAIHDKVHELNRRLEAIDWCSANTKLR